MADRGFSINVHIDGDSDVFTASLKEASSAVDGFKRNLGDMNRALTGTVGAVREVRDDLRSLDTTVGKVDRSLQSLQLWTGRARNEMRSAVPAITGMKAASIDLRNAQAELATAVRAAVTEVNDEGRSFAENAVKAGLINDVIGELVRTHMEAASAAEAEARAVDELGDAAARTAAKLAALDGVNQHQMSMFERNVGKARTLQDGNQGVLNLFGTTPSSQPMMSAQHTGHADFKAMIQDYRDAIRAAEEVKLANYELYKALEMEGVMSWDAETAAVEENTRAKERNAAMNAVDGGGGGGGLGGMFYHKGAPLPWFLGGGLLTAGGILPMAGMGPERLVTGGLAIAGSAAGAAAGAGLIGLGAAGTLAVGGGSDMAVMKSTISDTKTLYQDYQQLTKAQEEFGKGSRQAALAQANLNYEMKNLGPAAGVELGLAKQFASLNNLWDQVTGKARGAAVNILEQFVQLGHDYVGRVASAAFENLSIINRDIKPLFAWLEGPTGVKIWNDLENQFKKNLPIAVHAFTMGMEVLLRVMDLASPYVGSLTQHIDKLLTHLNNHNNTWFADHIAHFVKDLRIWEHFLKAFATDAYRLFKAGAGEGNQLIITFTKWLVQFGVWEKSAKGSAFLHTFFAQRAKELDAILKLVPIAAKSFGSIYIAVQPLVPVLTMLTNLFAGLLSDLGKVAPGVETAIAALILFRKYLPGGAGGFLKNVLWGGAAGAAGTAAGVAGAGAVAAEGTAVTAAATPAIEASLGTAVEATLGGGLIGAFTKFAPIATKILRAGLIMDVAGGVLDGLSKAAQTQGSFGTKADAFLGGFANSVSFGLIPDSAFTAQASNAERGRGPTFDVRSVQEYYKEVSAVSDKLGSLDHQKLSDLMREGQQLAGDPALAKYHTQLENLIGVLKGDGALPNALAATSRAFAITAQAAGGSLHDIQSATDKAAGVIEQILPAGSRVAGQAMSANFIQAAKDVQKSMAAGVVSTSAGIAQIDKYLTSALNSIGSPVKLSDIQAIGPAQAMALVGYQNSGGTGSFGAGHFAQGGILGNPNAAGKDMYHVVMGEGEAVLTRHQRAAIDTMLPAGVNVAGVVGNIKTPHYAATGFAPGQADVGSVNFYGKPSNVSPEIRQLIGLMEQKFPSLQVTATRDGTHASNSYHYLGEAVDMAGPGMDQASAWIMGSGLYRQLTEGIHNPNLSVEKGQVVSPGFWGASTWAEHLNHIHMAIAGGANFGGLSNGGPMGAIGNMLMAAATSLPHVKEQGSKGIMGAIAQGAINTYEKAAQQLLNTQSGTGSLAQWSQAGGSNAANQRLGKSMMGKWGFGVDQWPALLALWNRESGWNADAVNPSSGAYGIPQSLGHGHPYNMGDAGAQIAWGLNYIRQRYGSPDAAWAHETAYNWYAKGGIVGAAGGLATTARAHWGKKAPGGTGKKKTVTNGKVRTKRAPHLPGVKKIPGVAGLVDAFSYYYDDHAAQVDPKSGAINHVPYAGGNAAWLDRISGPTYDLLTGMLGLVDDTDPTTGAPITGGQYQYGANYFYPGDPANDAGYAAVWKYDQEIAARLGILGSEQDEQTNAGASLSNLTNKWIPNVKGRLTGMVDHAVTEGKDIAAYRKYLRYLTVKKGEQNFAGEREKIHRKFIMARSNLSARGANATFTTGQMYNTARGILEQERQDMLGALIAANILDPTTEGIERNAINADYFKQLTALEDRRAKWGLHTRLDGIRAREYLSLSENEQLFGLSQAESKYSLKRGIVNAALQNDVQDYNKTKHNAEILLRDLIAADQNADGPKLAAKLNKIGVTLGDSPISVSVTGTDMKTQIQTRINDLADAVAMEKFVTIPGLEKARNEVSGSSATGAADNSLIIGLLQEIANFAVTDVSVAQAQLGALQGFTPVLGSMGSYAKGGVVPETGMYLLHRDETVVPDSAGPSKGYPSSSGDTPQVNLELHLSGGLEALEPYIEMVIRKKGAAIVSSQLGSRRRAISGAPGNLSSIYG